MSIDSICRDLARNYGVPDAIVRGRADEGVRPSTIIATSLRRTLREVDQLNRAGPFLEELADHHPTMTEALVTIAQSIRSSATVLAVVVAMKGPKPS